MISLYFYSKQVKLNRDRHIQTVFQKMKIEGEMPPTIQTCFHLGVENDKTSFSLTPYGGNNGLGRLEGRFSYINPEYFTMVKDIERNKHLEANTEIITVKYMPKEHHYYNIMNDCYEGNFNLQFGTAENHKSLSLENLFIGVQDNKLTFFSCLNGNEKIVKFEQYNVSNIEHFSPHVLNDLLFWSSNYYSNLMSLIFDIQKLRKDFIYFPRVHFKGLELFPQSWLIKNYLEDGLQKDEFFSKFDDMKKIYEIPDSFFIRTNDLRLLIDTNCEDDLDILWDIYKKILIWICTLKQNQWIFQTQPQLTLKEITIYLSLFSILYLKRLTLRN
ncbi:lantibiotic dehydratase [Bacillus thuringiensis]